MHAYIPQAFNVLLLLCKYWSCAVQTLRGCTCPQLSKSKKFNSNRTCWSLWNIWSPWNLQSPWNMMSLHGTCGSLWSMRSPHHSPTSPSQFLHGFLFPFFYFIIHIIITSLIFLLLFILAILSNNLSFLPIIIWTIFTSTFFFF